MDLITVNEFAVVRWFVVQLEGGQYHGLGAITLHSSNWARSRSRSLLAILCWARFLTCSTQKTTLIMRRRSACKKARSVWPSHQRVWRHLRALPTLCGCGCQPLARSLTLYLEVKYCLPIHKQKENDQEHKFLHTTSLL